MKTNGEYRQAQQHDAEDGAEQQLRPLGPLHPRLLEQRHPVGDGLDAREGAAPGRERLEHQQHAEGLGRDRKQGTARLRSVLGQGVEEPDRDNRQQPEDEDERREQERSGPLAQAPQVENCHQGQDPEADRDGLAMERRVGGGQGTDSRRDRHCHGEGVVDDQRRRRQLAGAAAKVVLGYGIGTTTSRVGVDDLPVGENQESEQDDDGNGDRQDGVK
jgi:hypothetical protein